jgi:hypothetical protein
MLYGCSAGRRQRVAAVYLEAQRVGDILYRFLLIFFLL